MRKDFVSDMTKGNPSKLLLQFAFPMLIGNLFQQLYNMVDAIVVGKFSGPNGENALAAVGSVSSLNFVIFSLTMGLAAGIGVVISQYFGARDYENVTRSFSTATYMLFVVSLIMGAIGFFGSRTFLEILDTPPAIIDDADIYFKICCLGIIGNTGYNGMAAVLRALGDSITPLIFLIVACIVNIVLDLVFVILFGMGVPGVAIATIISQAFAAVGCIIYGLKKVDMLRMPIKKFVIHKDIMHKCITLGLPAALQNSFVAISTIVIQRVTNQYGETIVAASTAAARLEMLVLQPGMSLGMALSNYTGQNIGAGRIDRAKQGFWAATKIIIVFSLVMTPLVYFGGRSIMNLFTNEPVVADIGARAIRVTSMFYIPVGMIYVSRNLLSGAGDMKIPMIMGISEVLCRVIFVNVLTMIPAIGFMGIWWASGLNWFVTGGIGCLRYATGRWKSKSIVPEHELKS